MTKIKYETFALIVAIEIILASLLIHIFSAGNDYGASSHFSSGDSATLHYIAEIFWGIDHSLFSRVNGSTDNWRRYIESIPMRGVGPGTYYIIVYNIVSAIDSSWVKDLNIFGVIYCSILKFLKIVAFVTFYLCCKKRYGCEVSLIGLFFLIFLWPAQWSFTHTWYMADPIIRITMLFLLSFVLSLDTSKRLTYKNCLILAIFFILLSSFKVQWYLLGFGLGGAFFLSFYRFNYSIKTLLPYILLVLIAPLTVLAINGLVFGYYTFSPGLGLWVHFKSNGAYLEYFCRHPTPDTIAFCQEEKEGWWRLHLGKGVPISTFKAFDKQAMEFVMQDPVRMANDFWKSLTYASNAMAGYWAKGILVRLVDIFSWLMLFMGLWRRETLVFAVFGLSLWFIPALGDVFAVHYPRYYEVVSGIPFILAMLIGVTYWCIWQKYREKKYAS